MRSSKRSVRNVVQGTSSPGFEKVHDAFARCDLGRGGAAFAVYVDGEKVVDFWAGEARPGIRWNERTMATAMSATKGLAALCVQMLHTRGLIDVDAPVSRYWPEYAQAGKEKTLVRHVLNHTSGMLCFEDPGSLLDWTGNGWDDYDEIARRIAISPPAWEPGTRIGYHAVSIGWLIQELVRRITGLTVGAYFAEEIARPLGLSAFIGTPVVEHSRIADLVRPGVTQKVAVAALDKLLFRPGSLLSQASLAMHGGTISRNIGFFDRACVRTLEIPAANASTDARSLARVYAVLAQGGELDGVRLVSPESVELFGTKSFGGSTAVWPEATALKLLKSPKMRYALGYEGDFGEATEPWRFGPSLEAFGHLGAGGQIGFADPARHVACGFVRNDLRDWTVSTTLIATVYDCL